LKGINALNRKIEANSGVGREFAGVSKLWKEYERVMAYTGEEKIATALPLASVAPGATASDDSFGAVAPGAGSTSYMP